jgi:hypothetical protein
VVEWLAAKRSAIGALLIIVSGGSLLIAWQSAPIALTKITSKTIYRVEYVGALEERVGRRLSSAGSRDAGYGIGWFEGSSQGRETYLPFSRLLELSEEDVRKIRAAGSPYRIGIHDRTIVTITGDNGNGIPYEEYAARTTKHRNTWLTVAVVFLVLAGAFQLFRHQQAV